MEMNGEQTIKKAKKLPIGIKAGYLICILAIIISVVVMYYRKEKQAPEATDFTKNGAIDMDTDIYAYLKVEGLTDEVAIYGNVEDKNDPTNDRYYLAISGGYLYIVNLNFEIIEQLREIQDYTNSTNENAVAPEPVTIYGMTEEIPSELKEMTLNYYNKSVSEENQISIDDFDNYFGSVLLNARKEAVNTFVEEMIIMVALIGLFIIIIAHIAIKVVARRTIKYIKKNAYEDDIAHQLDDCVEEKHYKEKVIFTKEYFVDIKNGFTAFKYTDVKWIHVHNVKYYRVLTVSSSIIIHLRDGKTNLQCVEIKGKATDEFLEVFNKICEKVPVDTLKGYTQENINAFKKYKKDLKRKVL